MEALPKEEGISPEAKDLKIRFSGEVNLRGGEVLSPVCLDEESRSSTRSEIPRRFVERLWFRVEGSSYWGSCWKK